MNGGQTLAACGRAADPTGRLLLLAPGAGSHRDHPTTRALADVFLARGFDVVRFDFLYRVAGRARPDRMPQLKACYAQVAQHARLAVRPRRLLIGGHSLGGRVASMLAAEGFDADGLLLLAYPLHPAGRPEQLRDAHLPDIRMPTLCLSGTRDALCERALMERVLPRLGSNFAMRWLDGADHGYNVLKRSGRTRADVLAEIGAAAQHWARTALPA